MSDLKECFRYWRQLGYSASEGIAKARADVAAEENRYPRHSYGMLREGANFNGVNPVDRDGLVWVEWPSDIGLRKVDFADKIIRLGHTGWFTEDDGMNGETMRGIVYQFPARGGKPRYVSGYADPCNADKHGNGPARLALYDVTDDKDDAARDADHIAERQADKERDYNRAWQAGNQFCGRNEQIKDARRACLALIAETRAACEAITGYAAIKAAIRARVTSYLDEIREAREERDRLQSDYGREEGFKNALADCS